jgi:Restriction endonuclease NaeI
LLDHPYPPNFWRTVPPDVVEQIFAGQSGNQLMANLFREVQGEPITRDVVEAVAQQQDFMRRIRSDNGRGTRDHLAREGILLLSGHYDAPLIAALGLPACSGSEFVSYRPMAQTEADLASSHGIALNWEPDA